MSADVLIEAGIGEVRAALVADGQLVGLAVARDESFDRGADIVLGRVTGHAPRMKTAEVALPGGATGLLADADRKSHPEGSSHILQIERHAQGRKGPRVTATVALAGRALVFIPSKPGIGLARGTEDRSGLTKKWRKLDGAGGGFLLRPVLGTVADETVEVEAMRLVQAWHDIQAAARRASAPALLMADLDPILRLLRDGPSLARIAVDDGVYAATLKETLRPVAPDLADKIELHRGPAPIFATDGIEDQIADALAERMELPGGIAIAIETTEALAAVDVDVGGAVDLPAACRGAADEIARQLRLRRIGGQIVVDFPRAKTLAERKKIASHFRARLAADPEPVNFGGLTALGLIELTRRRAGPALAELLGATDRTWRPDAATAARAALRRALIESRARPGRPVVLRASAAIAERLETTDSALVATLAARIGAAVRIERRDWAPDRAEAAVDG